jgi:hypothetical protein
MAAPDINYELFKKIANIHFATHFTASWALMPGVAVQLPPQLHPWVLHPKKQSD